MARWEFKLPDIGEGVTEGEIVSWLVKVGEVVTEDQPMVEVMTDKATVTIAAPKAGKIIEQRGKAGEVVQVHSVLVVFDIGGVTASQLAQQTSEPAPAAQAKSGNGTNGATHKDDGPAATAVGDIRENLPGMGSPMRGAGPAAGGATQVQPGYFNEKPLATPATRKTARDMNIDLKQVPPTGPQGRVTKADVEAFAKGGPESASDAGNQAESRADVAASTPPAPTGTHGTLHAPARDAVKITAPTPAQSALEARVPFAGVRRRIAAKMQQSTQTAAHFTFVEECDVTELKKLRARLKEPAQAQGVKLTFLPFIVKAVVAALKRHPILNSALDESTNELVYRKYYNIGIATSTDAGLMVPVVKEADRRSLLEIAQEVERLASDAKAAKSKIEDLSGSTFTITSLGAQGGLFATPIINFPEVGILGIHQIKQKPVVKNGEIVIGEVMLLSLSFDHRIVDGHVGAAFAYEIINYLENPDKLFLEMA